MVALDLSLDKNKMMIYAFHSIIIYCDPQSVLNMSEISQHQQAYE